MSKRACSYSWHRMASHRSRRSTRATPRGGVARYEAAAAIVPEFGKNRRCAYRTFWWRRGEGSTQTGAPVSTCVKRTVSCTLADM